MKILFLSDNFPPEGNAPATRLWEHATRWVAAGHEVTVITCAPNFPEGKVYPGYRNAWRSVEMMGSIRVVRVKTYITSNEGFVKRSLDYVSFMVAAVAAGLFERRPDVLIATSPQFFCACGGWILSALRRLPFVFELRDLWPASIVAVGAMRRSMIIRILESVEMFLYRRADRIVAVTQTFKRELVGRGVPADKISVVLNGVDLAQYQPREKSVELVRELGLAGATVAGYIGTHGMAHALDKVVDAAVRLKHRSDIKFVFVGGGAERENVERMIRDRGLTNAILVPRQPKERMPEIWSICDVAIVPLRNTPVFATVIPSKIFECMGMALPILMSLPSGEATAIIESTGAGVCVPPEDSAAMADAIEKMADCPAWRRSMAKAGKLAATRYTRDASAKRMLDVLDELVP